MATGDDAPVGREARLHALAHTRSRQFQCQGYDPMLSEKVQTQEVSKSNTMGTTPAWGQPTPLSSTVPLVVPGQELWALRKDRGQRESAKWVWWALDGEGVIESPLSDGAIPRSGAVPGPEIWELRKV